MIIGGQNIKIICKIVSEGERRRFLQEDDSILELGDIYSADECTLVEIMEKEYTQRILCADGSCMESQIILCGGGTLAIGCDCSFGIYHLERRGKWRSVYQSESTFYDFLQYKDILIVIFETEVILVQLSTLRAKHKYFDIIDGFKLDGDKFSLNDMSLNKDFIILDDIERLDGDWKTMNFSE